MRILFTNTGPWGSGSFTSIDGLATQLEQAKIKVKEETPVFTVLEPVKVPVNKSRPKKLFVVLGSLFIGVIVGIAAGIAQVLQCTVSPHPSGSISGS